MHCHDFNEPRHCFIFLPISAVVPREGAGVTPGLRRRRERAERQKSFMREQQDAAASGYRFGSVADESEHGKQANWMMMNRDAMLVLWVP